MGTYPSKPCKKAHLRQPPYRQGFGDDLGALRGTLRSEWSRVQQRGCGRRTCAASIHAKSHQIEPGKGYTADNVRLVCVAANFAMNAWGLDTLIRVATGVIKRAASERADPADHDWYASQDPRIEEAEQGAATLVGEPLRRQRARIAALKRARTLGPAGLKRAAKSAIATKAGNFEEATA